MRAVVMGSVVGTATAKVLVDAGVDTTMWARRPALRRCDQRLAHQPRLPTGHPHYLRRWPRSQPQALDGGRSLCARCRHTVARQPRRMARAPAADRVAGVAAGVETSTLDADDRGYRRGQWVPTDQIAVLSGPNLAREVAEQQPAATVIACPDGTAQQLQAGVLHRLPSGRTPPWWAAKSVALSRT